MARQTLKEVQVELPLMSAHPGGGQGLSHHPPLPLKAHPCSFFRPELERLGAVPAGRLEASPRAADLRGMVLVRRRPRHRQGGSLHDLGGRNWHGQCGVGMEGCFRRQSSADHGQPDRGAWAAPDRRRRHPRGGQELYRPLHLAAAMRREDPDAPLDRKDGGRLLASRDFH